MSLFIWIPYVELHYLYGFLLWNFIIYMDSICGISIIYMDSLCGISLFIWIPYVEFHYLYGFLMWNFIFLWSPYVEFQYLYGVLMWNFIICMDSLCEITLFIWIPYVEFYYLYGFLMWMKKCGPGSAGFSGSTLFSNKHLEFWKKICKSGQL